jgi:tRNA1Val (adenine37-N6)-methyltransferase
MKVNTDGVLLGAWVSVDGCSRALDVGAGSGLIALMIAQRNERLQVDGVESDADACVQAAENAAASPFAARIRIHCDTFERFAGIAPTHYDLIVSNPPYFAGSLQSSNPRRSMARQGDGLSPVALLNTGALLTSGGCLAMILPAIQERDLLRQAALTGWHVQRLTYVVSVPGAEPRRLLVELTQTPTFHAVDTLVLTNETRQRSDDYRALTRDFYL